MSKRDSEINTCRMQNQSVKAIEDRFDRREEKVALIGASAEAWLLASTKGL